MTFLQPATTSGLTGFPAEIVRGITDVIRHADRTSDRSQQKALGVSEVGDPCDRKLVYRMFGHPQTGVQSDPWKANVGTAMHEYLRWIYEKAGEKLDDGRDRYVLEQKVTVGVGLSGSCDHFDRKLRLVVDFKSKADAKACAKAAKDPAVESVVQDHCYAQGWINAGEQVEHVALVFIPRNGDLDGIAVWTEPFDPAVVERALERRNRLLQLGVDLDVEQNPEMYAVIPAEPSEMRCTFCSYFDRSSTNPAVACPGVGAQPKKEAA